MTLPTISFSKSTRRYILKRGGVVYLTRHPKAGRTGYSPDMLRASTDANPDYSSYDLVEANGIKVYISPNLSIDKYEQIDIWITRRYWFIVTLRARITLYKRLTN